jgi:hypothetical protein
MILPAHSLADEQHISTRRAVESVLCAKFIRSQTAIADAFRKNT